MHLVHYVLFALGAPALAFYQAVPYCPDIDKKRNTFLWRVRHRKWAASAPHSYLFGTIHVPYTEVWDFLDPAVLHAFRSSDNVVFELDLGDSDTLKSLSRCQLLPHGLQLHETLPPWLYAKLRRHLTRIRRDLSAWVTGSSLHRQFTAQNLFKNIAGNWRRKRAIWVMLAIQALTPESIKTSGVPVLDLYMARLARAYQKRTLSIERAQEQCRPLNRLRRRQVVYALNQTLWKHQKLLSRDVRSAAGDSTRSLVRAYNCGQLDHTVFKTDVLQLKDRPDAISQRLNRYFHKRLIRKRNKRMARRASRLMKRNRGQSFFFALGAGHYLGRRSVLHWLQRRGFIVERVEPTYANQRSFLSRSPHGSQHLSQMLAPSYRFRNRDASTSNPWMSDERRKRSWEKRLRSVERTESLWNLRSSFLSLSVFRTL